MTYELVTTIEELRAELGHCDPAERAPDPGGAGTGAGRT